VHGVAALQRSSAADSRVRCSALPRDDSEPLSCVSRVPGSTLSRALLVLSMHNTCSGPGVAQVRCCATLVQILVLHNCCTAVEQLSHSSYHKLAAPRNAVFLASICRAKNDPPVTKSGYGLLWGYRSELDGGPFEKTFLARCSKK